MYDINTDLRVRMYVVGWGKHPTTYNGPCWSYLNSRISPVEKANLSQGRDAKPQGLRCR
jgi:hypothetical protein